MGSFFGGVRSRGDQILFPLTDVNILIGDQKSQRDSPSRRDSVLYIP